MVLAGLESGKISVVRDLTADEAVSVETAMQALHQFGIDGHLFLIARVNHHVLSAAVSTELSRFKQTGMNRMAMMRFRMEINRHVMNFLGSVRSFLDQSDHLLSDRYGAGSAEREAFKKVTNDEYD